MGFRCFRRVYRPPQLRDVSRSIHIGVGQVATRSTKELLLALAIGFLAMTALGASAAGITSVHENYRNAEQLRLVVDELTKLREGPSSHLGSLRFAKPCPATYSFEILQRNTTSGVFGLRNEGLRDAVVGVTAEARFTLADALHGASSAPAGLTFTSHLFAERPANSGVLLANGLDLLASMDIAVGVGSEVGDAQVYTEKLGSLDGWIFRELPGGVEEELPVPVDEIDLAFEAIQPLGLILAKDVGQNLASLQGPERDVIQTLPGQNALIVGDGAVRLELWELRLVSAQHLDGFADGADGHLCGESVLLSQIVVASLVDAWLTGKAGLVANLSGMLGSGVERLHGVEQEGSVVAGKKLKLDSQSHASNIGAIRSPVKNGYAKAYRLKPVVSDPLRRQ
jgi:hypothetical protein